MAIPAWRLAPAPATGPGSVQRHGELPHTGRWFASLLASYGLEGIGYLIAGTFLVAAINENSPGWLGSSSWIVVGIAAVPAAAMWANLARRRSRSTLLLLALAIQAVGIALPALAHGVAPAMISAVLFGNTFMAISSLAVAIGAHLQFARSIAILTTGYSVGQFVGPLVVKPLLGSGYHSALLVGAAVVVAAAGCAALLRVRFPHRVGNLVEPSRQDIP
jgi:MFS family permease